MSTVKRVSFRTGKVERVELTEEQQAEHDAWVAASEAHEAKVQADRAATRSTVDLLDMLSADEHMALEQAAMSDPAAAMFMRLLTIRKTVDVRDPRVAAAVAHLGALLPARVQEALTP